MIKKRKTKLVLQTKYIDTGIIIKHAKIVKAKVEEKLGERAYIRYIYLLLRDSLLSRICIIINITDGSYIVYIRGTV